MIILIFLIINIKYFFLSLIVHKINMIKHFFNLIFFMINMFFHILILNVHKINIIL